MNEVMGSAGHAFIAHTKALSPCAQSKDGYGVPPHPLIARIGQRYWPRATRVRNVLVVRGVKRTRVVLVPDTSGAQVTIESERLLLLRSDGQGRNHQFLGFVARRYSTTAYVWAIDDTDAVLSVPEWHPSRPVRTPARLLPNDGRAAGNGPGGRGDQRPVGIERGSATARRFPGHPRTVPDGGPSPRARSPSRTT